MRQILFMLLLVAPNVFAATLQDLDFMTGHWQRSNADGFAEEWWMESRGNTKVAAFRWAQGDQLITVELVIISQEEDGIYLRFKHYGAQFDPWEKDEPNTYRLERAGGNEAVFVQISENKNAPQVMIYRLTDLGLLFRGTDNTIGEERESDLVIQFRMAPI